MSTLTRIILLAIALALTVPLAARAQTFPAPVYVAPVPVYVAPAPRDGRGEFVGHPVPAPVYVAPMPRDGRGEFVGNPVTQPVLPRGW